VDSAGGAGVFSGEDFGIEPQWNGRHDIGPLRAFQFKVLLDGKRRGTRECSRSRVVPDYQEGVPIMRTMRVLGAPDARRDRK
jgi:hypothetical protein